MAQLPTSPEAASRTIARGQVAEYDRVMREHHEAEDCRECETCLELGIQVFHWIIRADQDYRRELYNNPQFHDEAAEQELACFMRTWHSRGGALLDWAERNAARGFTVQHLDEFRHCSEEAAAIVESFEDTDDSQPLSEAIIILKDQALLEHRIGETAEFI